MSNETPKTLDELNALREQLTQVADDPEALKDERVYSRLFLNELDIGANRALFSRLDRNVALILQMQSERIFTLISRGRRRWRPV